MRTMKAIAAAVACVLLASGAGVAQGPAKAAKGKIPVVKLEDYRLKNGLRVILVEDHSAPTYAISVTYNVGSRDERPGRTGFAHLFEHMLFQGSENVGKGEHFILINNYGGSMNGTTNTDRTNYFQALPSNQLDLGLFLEADRMRSLDLSQANLDNQRNAVQEERRLRLDNAPYGKTFEVVGELAYDNFGYKHSTIGSMEDLNAATIADVTSFFKTYYAPNNAVLVLVGDFQTATAKQKIEKYFGSIPSQPAPPAVDMTEPKQTAERRATIEDQFARFPQVNIVYKIPAGNTPDWYALDILGNILGGGQSSRLYQRLVRQGQMAQFVNAGPQSRRGPSLFSVTARSLPGRKTEEIEKAVYEEIDRMKNELVTDAEMEKIRMQGRRQLIQQRASNLGLAIGLGQAAVYFNDPGLLNTLEAKYDKVTKEDIQRVAKEYLIETNRTVVTTQPKGGAQPARSASGQ